MKYLRVEIKNIEPLSISDDSTSQSGQVCCCRYIPGATLRGYVISSISNNADFFNKHKETLFKDICFMNGYPVFHINGKDTISIPALKGFYEDKKANGNIQNVVIDGKFDEGMKRASLGRFCVISDNEIRYSSIETGSSMKIKIGEKKEDQEVFRNEYITPGYTFESFVAIKDGIVDELVRAVRHCFENGHVILGNGRSQGFGKCVVKVSDCTLPEIFDYALKRDYSEGHVYMILLSNTVMRDRKGEYCGINIEYLKKVLGADTLEIEHCATTKVIVCGYNSTLGIKMPTVPMYEQGSVFKLRFSGTLSGEKMMSVYHNGIGERTVEGFGRVLFLGKTYEQLNSKAETELQTVIYDNDVTKTEEDERVIKVIAANYYRRIIRDEIQKSIIDKPKLRITKSQAGNVLSILEKNRYNPDVDDVINKYFEHAELKEGRQSVHKERVSIKRFSQEVTTILMSEGIAEYLSIDKGTIMGVKTSDLISSNENKQMIVAYVIELLKHSIKEA